MANARKRMTLRMNEMGDFGGGGAHQVQGGSDWNAMSDHVVVQILN